MSGTTTTTAEGGTFFGHPRGLATLFFTEMWERFSYYGMRALLVLYMTTATAGANPGLGLDVVSATALYALYTSLVYLLALPGGWLADQLWGQRKAVFIGGCIIAAGHFTMAIPSPKAFFTGLILVIIGTGLLKPNVSSLVGDLYPEGGVRRDAGFSVFYMGINLGGMLGPLVCAALGENYNWHLGFSAAGVGMVFGVVQFRRGFKHLGNAGVLSTERSSTELAALEKKFFGAVALVAAGIAAFGVLVANQTIDLTLPDIAGGFGSLIIVVVAVFFIYLHFFGGHTAEEMKRIWVIFWLFILAALFWSGFEQAGSSMNLFAQDFTDRSIGGWTFPAGWLQSVNSFFIIILAPVFGWLWLWLATRNANPSTPVKFGLGLLALGVGFFVLSWGAANASPTAKVSAAWLIVTYFFHTAGELALSPIGMSSITKLAPRSRVSQMMGVWFVGVALGNLIGGLAAGSMAPHTLFRTVAMLAGVAGLVALLASPVVNRVMKSVD